VAFAHAQGVIHRDLKPQNIMVGSFGEVLVMDWGVAKARGEQPMRSFDPRAPRPFPIDRPDAMPNTAHGTVLGTPGYMAPEQARGEIEQIDERTDVYALGALLHFLLTSEPASSAGRADLSAGRAAQRYALPRALQAICLKAMAIRKDERYQSVQALADDLVRFQAHERVEAYPEGLFGSIKRWVVRYRVALVLILAYLCMRILLLFFARS
jgi:serine/threonine protein kinase